VTVVDARGLRCPAPVIRLARAAKEAPPGTVLTVWWTDPAARHDIPAWARMRGHVVLGTDPLPDGDAHATHVRLAPGPSDHATRA
jgi:tRNA 2-thiouridine synthesizing protein A